MECGAFFDQIVMKSFISELTFIILDRDKYESDKNEIDAMIGDTNIFLRHDDGECGNLVGEIEIMIAEESARGKGHGLESTVIMLKYGVTALRIDTFEAKIGMANTKSIRMFQEKLGFKESSRSEVFQEITLSRKCDASLDVLLDGILGSKQLDIREI